MVKGKDIHYSSAVVDSVLDCVTAARWHPMYKIFTAGDRLLSLQFSVAQGKVTLFSLRAKVLTGFTAHVSC